SDESTTKGEGSPAILCFKQQCESTTESEGSPSILCFKQQCRKPAPAPSKKMALKFESWEEEVYNPGVPVLPRGLGVNRFTNLKSEKKITTPPPELVTVISSDDDNDVQVGSGKLQPHYAVHG
ncbi:Hypothetical predicted protein, partial [Paramuricea clavata]